MARPGNWKQPGAKHFAVPPLFDPRDGTTVREPLDKGQGWWAGAPSCVFDPMDDTFYLYYRLRKPRELGRGVQARIAASHDGLHFDDVWAASKHEIDTQSLEKSGLIRGPDSQWMLYLSFVDSQGRWCIEMCQSDTIDGFDAAKRTHILDADDINGEGVKDPCLYCIGGLYYMIVSYAPTPQTVDEQAQQQMHATGDVYNTGITKSHTGLAISEDALNWRWLGDILSPPDSGWDQYCTRIGSIIYMPPVFVGFYDGSASVQQNYEEKAGMCLSTDLRCWRRITTGGPFVLSPHAQKTIRYIEVVQRTDALYYYYEFTRPDGSHELRGNRVQW